MPVEEMRKELAAVVSQPLLIDEPMAQHTTIRIGGPADILAFPKNNEELKRLLVIAGQNRIHCFVLGWGSNLLVRDGGVRGLVINLTRGFQDVEVIADNDGEVLLRVGAGVKVPGLMDTLIKEGLAGLEFMTSIPATIGGAIRMNAGTPEGEIGKHVKSVSILTKTGQPKTLDRKDCGFAYRTSRFPAGSVIIAAELALKRGDPEQIRAAVEAKKTSRVSTQPLNVPNLGSVFKNPSKREHAGRLIEEAGLKDVRVGQARISEKHGNFIVNEGGATAKDVLALIGLIKDKVKEKYNIRLETEVLVVGEAA